MERVSGTSESTSRTVTVTSTIDRNNGKDPVKYRLSVLMVKENEQWYVDPQSLQSNEKETSTETAPSSNTTPTQPPLYTGTPDTPLYYNPNGGSMYHLDPDCPSVGDRYKPMAQFYFRELGQSPYSALRPCNQCGAPIPDD